MSPATTPASSLGVKAFTAAVLGGIGNLRGALLGGFVLGLAENYGSALIGTEWKDVVAFVLLVVILLFRPTGLLGESLEGTGMSAHDRPTPARLQERVAACRASRILLWVLVGVFLFALPLLNIPVITTPDSDFGGVLFTVATYVLVALGLNIVVGYAGLLDLGYVGFYAVGAYTVAVLSSEHGHLPWLVTVPIAVVAALVSGVILGAPTLRVRGDYLAIVTLGFGEIIRLTAINSDWLGGNAGISNVPRPPSIELGRDPAPGLEQPGRRSSTWTPRPPS